MKKRILSMFLAALMIIGSVGTFAIGASASGKLDLSVEIGEIEGDTFYVDVKTANNPGFASGKIILGFDKKVVQPVSLVRLNALNLMSDYQANYQSNLTEPGVDKTQLDFVTGVFFGDNILPHPDYPVESGLLMRVNFKLVDPATFVGTSFTLSAEGLIDQNRVAVPFTASGADKTLPTITGVTMDGATYPYDGQPHSLSVKGATDDMTVSYNVKDVKNATTYDVVATVTKAGYAPLTLTADLVITPKALTVSGVDALDKEFDGKTTVTVDSANKALVGVVPGDTVNVTVPAEGNTADANVGTNKAVTLDKLTIDNPNYILTQPTVDVNVSALEVVVTATDADKQMNTADPTFTYTTVPSIAELQAMDKSFTVTGALTRDPGTAAGKYAIKQGTLSFGSNYKIKFVAGTFTINTKPLQKVAMNIVPESFTYSDDAGFAIAAKITEGNTAAGITYKSANPDVATVDAAGNVTFLKAGTATVTVSVPGNDKFADYSQVLTFNIAKKKVTVTPTLPAAAFFYGDDIPLSCKSEPQIEFTGKLALSSYDAGIQNIVLGTLAPKNDSYEIVFVSGKTVNIGKKTAEVTGVELWPVMKGDAEAKIKVDSVLTVKASDIVGSDSVAVTNIDIAVAKLVSGTTNTYEIEFGSSNPNYQLIAVADAKVFEDENKLTEEVKNEVEKDATVIDAVPGSDDVASVLSGFSNETLPEKVTVVFISSSNTEVIDEDGKIIASSKEELVNVTVEYYYNGKSTGITAKIPVKVAKKADTDLLQALLMYYHRVNSEKSTVETVKANIATGTEVNAGTKITLTSATAGATIYYTTDGSAPSVLSTVYTGPIVINANTTISAIATKNGMNTSAAVSYKYTVDSTTVTLKENAADIKYMDGRGDKFEPTAFATRYEVITALNNVFDVKTDNKPLTFTDVDADHKAVVDLFTAAGIINGYADDNTFRGKNNITRAELATLICRVMGLDTENAKSAGFTDVSGWAAKYINACAEAGYVKGVGDNKYNPNEFIKRCDLVMLINRITGAKAGTACSYSDVPAGTYYFGDVAAAAK